jgi:predicted nucleic acid-binding Zn ribbon protein
MNSHLRAAVLSEWRGLPQPEPQADNLIGVEQAVEKFLQKLGLSERLEETQIQAAWQSVVGEFLAAHSAPVGLQDGTLTIRVSHPAVRYELETAWTKRILGHLHKCFPRAKVRKLRFQT